MAENRISPPVLGISWDGTGYGTDGTIWGGEFLSVDNSSFVRAGHFDPFPLPGGEIAIKEPRRSALGLLYATLGPELFVPKNSALLSNFESREVTVIRKMLEEEINSPKTSSVGRLFDAVSSILGLCRVSTFEGEAAMAVEFCAKRSGSEDHYDFQLKESADAIVVDWRPLVKALLFDKHRGTKVEDSSAKFHNTLVEILISVCEKRRTPAVALSGGCFQNKVLCERAIKRLIEEGFKPYWHHQVPPNDGGIALGQIAAASRIEHKE
jgi:hydrogenase maturation protein HypF